MWARAALFAAALAMVGSAHASAATLERVGFFDRPMSVVSDPADPDQLFVAEREGRIQASDGAGGFELWADLTGLVACCDGELALTSIVPSPDFATSGRIYAAYSGETTAGGGFGDIHVDAFSHSQQGALVREQVMTIPHPVDQNIHHGGQLQFGPDGLLYVSVGDGGPGGDPEGRAQSLDTLLGKVLRIAPAPGEEPAYATPQDNPLAELPGEDEIWSYGLRNPWRFSFDRLAGDMILTDVGQSEREEVNFVASPAEGVVGGAGANYGWNCREGLIAYPDPSPDCPATGFTAPVFDYPHSDPGDGGAHGCSITGGFVVRDPTVTDLFGRYVYSDFCEGQIRSLSLPATSGGAATDDRPEGLEVERPASFGEDAIGRVYVASHRGGPENRGTLYRLAPGQAPPQPTPPVLPAPLPLPPQRTEPPELTVQLRLVRRGEGGLSILVVRVRPCAGHRGRRVLLKHGGERWKSKRLNDRCVARFVAGRTGGSFRAVLPGAPPQRSQVRTIAFAKPTP